MEGITAGTIRLGATEIRFRRAGRGAPVLLLLSCDDGIAGGDELFRRLAEEVRVVALRLDPVHGSASDPDASTLLRDLGEGLGLQEPLVVADEAWAARLTRGGRSGPAPSPVVWRAEETAWTIRTLLDALRDGATRPAATRVPRMPQWDSDSRS